ncbi:MAG: trehalose-phosphatase [Candidatus Omnitrophica bacterium]|nr:trehalose-phosphatase [Candidatus Omnitrophota bacterium]
MEHLLKNLGKIEEKLRSKPIFLFLDYDGTLTPIVDSPKKAFISKKTKKVLEALIKTPGYKIAVVSGRRLEDVRRKVGLRGIIYVGNHGLEIEGPKIGYSAPVPSGYRLALRKIKKELVDNLSVFKGVFVEDKGLSLSLHFRLAKKELIPKIKTVFHETAILHIAKGYIRIRTGKMVLEVRPALNWDKGKVVLWLMARQKYALNGTPFLPIYIGDDDTDEDAFRALKNRGVTVFVGRPKSSAAGYYLSDYNEVSDFFKRILQLKGRG